MIERISNIFDYGDEIVLAGPDRPTDTARIKEMTMKKVHAQNSPQDKTEARVRSRRAPGRRILLAAAIAAILAGSALAVYQHTMQERLATDIPLFEGKDLYHYSVSGASDPDDSLSADAAGTPEFLANAEWCDYLYSDHEQDYDTRLPEDSPYLAYTVWSAMADKLQSIADRYQLRLFKRASFTNSLEEFFAFPEIGGAFMLLEGGDLVECVAQTYDDGSFLLGGVKAPIDSGGSKSAVNLQITRAMKGTLTDFSATGSGPESYTCESYVTAAGTTVELALGEDDALVFAELDNCWVTLDISGTLDMKALQSLADSVDFAILNAS